MRSIAGSQFGKHVAQLAGIGLLLVKDYTCQD
jgi:hypothetical protein